MERPGKTSVASSYFGRAPLVCNFRLMFPHPPFHLEGENPDQSPHLRGSSHSYLLERAVYRSGQYFPSLAVFATQLYILVQAKHW